MKKVEIKLLVVIVATTLVACEKPEALIAAPRPALVTTIRTAADQQTMAITGEIKPRYTSTEGFRVAGKIIKRYVEEGQVVQKGQLLVQLDSADARLSLQTNQADIQAADAQLALAKTNLERQRQLLAQHFISDAALDRFESDYKTALARLTQTKAQAALSNNLSSYTSLVADRAGIVSMVNAEPGQVVATGEPVVEVIDPTQLEVHIPVAESRLQQLAIGDVASMRLWVDQAVSYPVKVREIAPIADEASRTFLVKLSLHKPNKTVKIGMTAGVIFKSTAPDRLIVPSAAVVERDNQTVVWKVDQDNKVYPQPVEVFSFSENGVIIKSGLKPNDKIVVAGAHSLIKDQVINPIER